MFLVSHGAVRLGPGEPMEFYSFLRSAIAWTATIACLWPVNVPLLYLAHRIREGRLEEDDDNRMDNDELWTRAFLGSTLVALLMAAFVFADLVLADWLSFPAGIIHLVVFLSFIPAAAYLLMQFFAYDDFFYGLSLLFLYLYLPIFVLLALHTFTGLWNWPLGFVLQFLKEATV